MERRFCGSRYNRDDWAIDRYQKPWSEQLPENDKLIVNGTTYVLGTIALQIIFSKTLNLLFINGALLYRGNPCMYAL